MPDLATRLRTIRDGLHAGCTVNELTADLEVALSLVERSDGRPMIYVDGAYEPGITDAVRQAVAMALNS